MSEEVFSTVFETVFIEKGAAEAKRAVTDLNDSYETMKSTLIDAANMVGVLDNKQVEARKKVNMTRKEFTALRDEILKAKDGHAAYNMALDLGSKLNNKAVSTQRAQVLQYIELNKSARNLVLTEKQSHISIDQLEKSYKKLNSSTRTAKDAQKAYDAALASGDTKLIASATERLTRAHTNQQRKLAELGEMYRTFGTVYQSLTEGSETYRATMSRMHLSTDDYRKLLGMYNKELASLSSQLGNVKGDSSQYMAILGRMTQIQMESERTTKAMAPALRREAQELKQKAIEAARLERELARLHVQEQRSNREVPTSNNRGGLYSALSNKEDSYLLANMRRVGMISPQVAQLSYVLSAITSTAALATVGIVATAVALTKLSISAVKAAAELQKYGVTLRSLATHGWDVADQTEAATQALGKAVSQDMLNYAAGSIYALDKIADGTEKLVGYGIDMRLVNQEMEMLGNLALGDSQRLENLAIAYGQVFGQGKARAQEMYQFINAGIPIFELLAQKTGKTTDVIMDMTRNGEVSFEMVRDLLKDITSETGRYHNLMQDIANMSFEGNWTKFLNEMKLLMANIGDSLLPEVIRVLQQANEFLRESRNDRTRQEVLADYVRTQEYGSAYAKAHIFDKVGTKQLDMLVTESALAERILAQNAKSNPSLRTLIPLEQQYPGFQMLEKAQARKYIPDDDIAQQIKTLNESIMRGSGAEGIAVFTDFMQQNLGLNAEQIKPILLDTIYKGRVTDGKHSTLTEIAETTRASTISDNMLLNIYTQLVKKLESKANAAKDNVLPADFKRDAEAELKAREGLLLTGAGRTTDKPGKDRQYLLDQYIENLTEENEQIREMVPFYREYIKLRQMRDKDIRPDGDKAGMAPDLAEQRVAEAKALYATNEALKLVNKSYQVLYDRRKGLEAIEDPIETSLTGLSGLLERTENIDDRNFILLLIKLAEKGSSIERVVSTVERVNKALGKQRGDTRGAIATDLAFSGGVQGAGGEQLALTGDAVTLLSTLSNYSDAYAESVLSIAQNMQLYASSTTEALNETNALVHALQLAVANGGDLKKLLSDANVQKLLRAEQDKFVDTAANRLASRMDGPGVWSYNAKEAQLRGTMEQLMLKRAAVMTQVEMFKSNGESQELTAAAQKDYERYTKAIEDNAAALARAATTTQLLNNTLSDTEKIFTLLSEMAPDERDAFVAEAKRTGVWEGLHDSVYAKGANSIMTPGAAASAAVQRYKKQENSALLGKQMGSLVEAQGRLKDAQDAGESPEVIAQWTTEVDRLTKAYDKLGTAVGIVGATMGSIAELAVNEVFTGLDETLYMLGRDLAGTDNAFKDLGETWKQVGRNILNQLPSIFLQGAMAAFTNGHLYLGLALMAAGLGTSVIGGIMGSREEIEKEDDSTLKMMENLQKQFQTMIEQFEAGLLYMDRARAAYISERQIAQVQGFANGGAFGGTGLAHGVYRQPTYFNAYASGDVFNSVMAEAGPEAVLPLRRGSSGQLGVVATGGSGMQVNMILEDHVGVKMTVADVRQTSSGYDIIAVVEGALVSTIAKGKADNVLRSRYNLKAVGRQ